jgi:hypothetical protein
MRSEAVMQPHLFGNLNFHASNGPNGKQGNGNSRYEPLSSVWERSDGELLEAMLAFYASIDPEPILDATYNTGRFWKGSSRRVCSMDIDPRYRLKGTVPFFATAS